MMAYSYTAGTNWCHDFPKLARDSGFYFNSHQTRVRVDWNRLSTIDIDRVIQERDFLTVDGNIKNVVDYHLESEYDVKILDHNFVKLFRLAQLSVEYLLYCKQYLDRSVIILKDELRSKLEENDKLKKEMMSMKENNKDLKDKFRDKYKLIEKTFSDSHGEIHKCPYCQKTFISAVFMNSHVARRHSNASQQSVSTPVHEQYKAETEKLYNEIKNLKERLNQTERVIRIESDSVESNNERYSDVKNGRLDHDKRLEDEHKRYREEINNLTTMLFSEIRSLKRDDKNNISEKSETVNDNWKVLLKQQENEIQQLRNELEHLTIKKSTADLDSIKKKLNDQEEHWQAKIELLESKHRNDIDKLYSQLKMTQESADRMREDYISKINELEQSQINVLLSGQSLQSQEYSIDKTQKSSNGIRELDKGPITHRKFDWTDKELVVEDIDHQSEVKITDNLVPHGKSQRITVNALNTPLTSADKHNEIKEIKIKKPQSNTIQLKGNSYKWNVNDKFRPADNDKEHEVTSENKQMDITSSESDESESATESTSTSETSESEEKLNTGSDAEQSESSRQEELQENRQVHQRKSIKTKEELSTYVQQNLEQKLKDLGIDPEWRGIPKATYKQSLDTIKYHRRISWNKFPKFEETRRKIIQQLTQKIASHQKHKKLNTVASSKTSPFNNLMGIKTKALKALSINDNHTPKVKSRTANTHEKPVANKSNFQLLPQKINQQEFHVVKSVSRIKSQRSRPIRDTKLASSSFNDFNQERYTSSPIRSNTKSVESIDTKLLSHSYESIKDYVKDSSASRLLNHPFSDSGLITTSTPQMNRMHDLYDKASTLNLSSSKPKLSETSSQPNSPKNNKSVLKSATGSTGSLVKKRVLFDLHTQVNGDHTIEQKKLEKNPKKITDVKESDSGSDYEISSISEEIKINTLPSSDNIVLKTSQSEKIAEISKKIESQLSLSRQKPIGGIETIRVKEFNPNGENRIEHNLTEELVAFSNSKISTNKLPQVTLPSPRNNYHLSHHDDSKESNLDDDIEELLGMN